MEQQQIGTNEPLHCNSEGSLVSEHSVREALSKKTLQSTPSLEKGAAQVESRGKAGVLHTSIAAQE